MQEIMWYKLRRSIVWMNIRRRTSEINGLLKYRASVLRRYPNMLCIFILANRQFSFYAVQWPLDNKAEEEAAAR